MLFSSIMYSIYILAMITLPFATALSSTVNAVSTCICPLALLVYFLSQSEQICSNLFLHYQSQPQEAALKSEVTAKAGFSF